jgi:FKBP-type peptidyl-prolyl cis-trans isomerase FkpA
MRPLRLLLPVLALAITSPVVACNDDDGPTESSPSTGEPLTTTYATSLGVDLPGSTIKNGVYYRQIAASTAPGVPVTASPGQRVSVRYTGWLPNGTQFDTGVYDFVLGTGNAIAGWHRGIAGMRVGERGQLVIPAALGYGANANGPIPANSVLVFNVELLSAVTP